LALVNMLDLGTAPEMRKCPECGREGLSQATRCGYCWAALPVLKAKLAA
jgi:predicted amidophosphoribosyltransferase